VVSPLFSEGFEGYGFVQAKVRFMSLVYFYCFGSFEEPEEPTETVFHWVSPSSLVSSRMLRTRWAQAAVEAVALRYYGKGTVKFDQPPSKPSGRNDGNDRKAIDASGAIGWTDCP